MENSNQKSRASLNNAIVVFFIGLIGGMIFIVAGHAYNEPMATWWGFVCIIAGIVIGPLLYCVYVWRTRPKKVPEIRNIKSAQQQKTN